MRPAVGGEGDGVTLAERTGDDERVVADGGDDIGARFGGDAVIAEERRPLAGQAGDDRVILRGDRRDDTLRHLDPVVVGKDGHGKGLLDGAPVVAGLGVDPLKSHVAADHDEAAAASDVVAKRGEAVGERLEAEEGLGAEEERVRADVGEDDTVVGSKLGDSRRKIAGGNVGGLVVDLPAAAFERGAEPADAFGVFGGGEGIEALLVDAVDRPGFAGDQDARGARHVRSSPSEVVAGSRQQGGRRRRRRRP